MDDITASCLYRMDVWICPRQEDWQMRNGIHAELIRIGIKKNSPEGGQRIEDEIGQRAMMARVRVLALVAFIRMDVFLASPRQNPH